MGGKRGHAQGMLTAEELELVAAYRNGPDNARRMLLAIAREVNKYDRHGEHVGRVRVVGGDRRKS